ncbi:MAG: flavin reductase family protein [Planctomycetota bacterium]|nr:flavin reductase family protein [Planctomycetota bacterium]
MKKSLGPRTLAFTTPVWCIGTYDANDKPNVMTVAWGGICCSVPPCVNFSLRKATYTYECVLRHNAFTVNIPSARYVKEADFFGIASGKNTDKFKVARLTPVLSTLVHAPMVDEFPMVLECKLVFHHELGLHTIFVGEVLDVKCDESVLNKSGLPDIEKVQPLVFSPDVRCYHSVGSLVGRAFEIGRTLR